MKHLPAILLLISAPLASGAVSLSVTGTLNNPSGGSAADLSGAQFEVKTVFVEEFYVSDGGDPTPYPVVVGVNALTSITISGASNPSLNGTFGHFTGSSSALYYPTYAGLYGGVGDLGILYFDLGGGRYIGAGFWTDATVSGAGVGVGDPVDLAHFGTGSVKPATVFNETIFIYNDGSSNGTLQITDGSFSPTLIPEPGVLGLALFGVLGLASRRRAA